MLSFEAMSIIATVIYGYASIAGIIIYRKLDKPSRILLFLMVLTMINDWIATISAYWYKNNNVVYGFFSPIQLILICLYFNQIVDTLKPKNLGVLIAIFFASVGYIDYFFIHSPKDFNGNFLIIESLVVTALCLYSFYRMLLLDDSMNLSKYIHFWFSAIWMFFWTCTFFVWGTYKYLTKNVGVGNNLIQYALVISNVITYVGFGTVFLLHDKMKVSNGK